MSEPVFVIMAAGYGSRVSRAGGDLHKALLPLGGRAVISHLIDRAPAGADIIVCLGHRGDQVKQYLERAHPGRLITYVNANLRLSDAGPGRTLLAAKPAVGNSDMIFTTCDTLWAQDATLWTPGDESWVAVARVPAGTEPERWCRFECTSDGVAVNVRDKRRGGPRNWAYTGLARIVSRDLGAFWAGVESDSSVHYKTGERQVTGGLGALLPLPTRRIDWTDVGDESAYRDAVARTDGYDFTKLLEATYVLPDQGRVVKWWANEDTPRRRHKRGKLLGDAIPGLLPSAGNFLTYDFVPGVTGYDAAEADGTWVTKRLLSWASRTIWIPQDPGHSKVSTCLRFYRKKTHQRIRMLPPNLADTALEAVRDVDWMHLAETVVPTRVHGDFNHGNIIVAHAGGFFGIDWREDFGGALEWGDMRWDLGKLLAGTVVHWDRARRGDFRPWDKGRDHAHVIKRYTAFPREVEIIGALSLLNSAPLHADPLPEILVARACHWLESVL